MTEAFMTAVNVKAIRVGITGVDSLFTFVDISTSESITTVSIRACTSETTNTIGTSSHRITTGLAIGTFVNIDALSITEHETGETSTMEGTRIIDT
jgi:hypothetical protein